MQIRNQMALTSLAEKILGKAKTLDKWIEAHGQAPQSFQSDSLKNAPRHIKRLQEDLQSDASLLSDLVESPNTFIFRKLSSWADLLVLQFLTHFQVAKHVPLNGKASYEELAAAFKLETHMVKVFLQQAMTLHIFEQSPEGFVVHTKLSRDLATDPYMAGSIDFHVYSLAPAAAKYMEALQKWSISQEPNETAYGLALDWNGTFFEHMAHDHSRVIHFGSMLKYLAASGGKWTVSQISNDFDWIAIDQPGSTVVDIGGGHGYFSKAIAQHTQHLRFIVQDRPEVVTVAQEQLEPHLQHRIQFQAQDILAPQTLAKPPTILFLHLILHDWSDKYVIQILRNLVPAMSSNTRLLIVEYILDDEPTDGQFAKVPLNVDVMMRICFNGRERTVKDFQDVLTKADSRFVVSRMIGSSANSIRAIEVTWEEDEVSSQSSSL